MAETRFLRRIIRLGSSVAITLPPSLAPRSEFVWVERKGDELIIKPAEVR